LYVSFSSEVSSKQIFDTCHAFKLFQNNQANRSIFKEETKQKKHQPPTFGVEGSTPAYLNFGPGGKQNITCVKGFAEAPAFLKKRAKMQKRSLRQRLVR
jgi:hypothetical protein